MYYYHNNYYYYHYYYYFGEKFVWNRQNGINLEERGDFDGFQCTYITVRMESDLYCHGSLQKIRRAALRSLRLEFGKIAFKFYPKLSHASKCMHCLLLHYDKSLSYIRSCCLNTKKKQC